ncbi:hypothetical protein BY458DRAFT_509589 [Sporodiniella umbellata]|nr:hypothetical protein BY458DRAFT_509589 [Sporodiniella umbellata]
MYYFSSSYHSNGMPLTPNSISPSSLRECSLKENLVETPDRPEAAIDYPQEITWLFFKDNQWVPFQYNNHYKIEQAFTLGDIKGKKTTYVQYIYRD